MKRTSRKSTKSAGQTAMAHARAWVSGRHPGALVLEAGARLSRFPDPKRPGEFITHTTREDLFGVFDMAVFPKRHFPTGDQACIELIQVTTIQKDELAAVRSRKSKVGSWIRLHLGDEPPDWLAAIYIAAWLPRTHLRIWKWSWERMDSHTIGGWVEQPPDHAKLPKQKRSAPASTRSTLSLVESPFA